MTAWAVVAAVVLIGCLFQSAVGFGANLIAMPIVVQVRPDLVPGSVVVASVVLNVLVMTRDRAALEPRGLSVAAVGAVAGSTVAATIVARASDDAIQLLVACSVLAMVCVVGLAGSSPRRSGRNLLLAGTASGFSSTTAGIGGPPIALLYADAEGSEVRAALSTFFLFLSTVTLVNLHLAGRLDGDRVLAGLALIPSVVAGFALGGRLTPVVDRGFTRPAILLVSAASALVLLARLALG